MWFDSNQGSIRTNQVRFVLQVLAQQFFLTKWAEKKWSGSIRTLPGSIRTSAVGDFSKTTIFNTNKVQPKTLKQIWDKEQFEKHTIQFKNMQSNSKQNNKNKNKHVQGFKIHGMKK